MNWKDEAIKLVEADYGGNPFEAKQKFINAVESLLSKQQKFWYCKKDELWVRNGTKCPICKKANYKELVEKMEKMKSHASHKDLRTNKDWQGDCCMIDDKNVAEGKTSSGYNQALDQVIKLLNK